MMHAASRAALSALRESFAGLSGRAATAGGLIELAGELYAVVDVFIAQPQLRRTAGDPARTPESRAGLVSGIFEGKVSPAALELIRAAAAQRWSSPWDLGDSLEVLADEALLRAAEQEGKLDDVEDELFRFERLLDAQPQLATLLDERVAPGARRAALLRDLVAGRVHPVTLALLEHAVRSTRKRSLEFAIDDLLEAAAARRESSIARVASAVPLTEQQEARLADVLAGMYGRRIEIRTAVDPQVRGGLVIRVGGEVIDGSIASRFAAARAALAGS